MAPSSSGRLVPRPAQALFVGIAVLGALLLLWPQPVSQGERLTTSRRGETRAPLWADHAPRKEEYTRVLHPAPPATAGESRGETATSGTKELLEELERLLMAFEQPTRVHATGRMQRTLGSGRWFETSIELDLSSAGPPGDGHFDLTVHHSPSAWSRYRGTIRERRAVDLRPVAVHGRDAPRFPAEAVGGELDKRVPLALGDLHLSDLDGLVGALVLGDLDLVGELRDPGAEPLLVVDLRFPDRPGPAEVSEFSTRGETALVHVGALDRRPRTLRVFDRGGRLVRTYSDFTFSASGESRGPAVRSFRVDSIASRSHTVVTIDRFELTAP